MILTMAVWTVGSLVAGAIFRDRGFWSALAYGLLGGAACGLFMGVGLTDRQDD
ncbi:hypothetical protein [Luteipulveratus halotolerans]|uniref:hypothetical protein n=1 Tax=Luteipulveratus halotolerans TaxID=1631356 RepID=UPI0012F95F3E|nr:hypothetical protein [Luteipulveratus halotolerans]